jgi:hypothetical protein
MDPKEFKQRLEEIAVIKYSEESGGWVIKKFKPCVSHCDYCDQDRQDLLVRSTLCSAPFVYWRHHCKTCRQYLHPDTRKPISNNLTMAAHKIVSVHRKRRKNAKLGLDNINEPELTEEPVFLYDQIDQDGRPLTLEEHGEITIRRWQD